MGDDLRISADSAHRLAFVPPKLTDTHEAGAPAPCERTASLPRDVMIIYVTAYIEDFFLRRATHDSRCVFLNKVQGTIRRMGTNTC